MRAYRAQIISNLRLMMRDRAVVFFSLLFPLIFFILFAQVSHASKDPGATMQVISMVIVIGVLGNGLFGAGMRTVQDRETNVLRRFKVAPISPLPVLVSSLVSGLVNFIPTVILIFAISNLVYGMPLPHNLLSVFVFILLAVVAFRTLGVIVAAVVNSAQEGNILIQILYLPMLFLSGATFPVSIMPSWVQILAGFLPATYLYSGMQSMLIEGQPLWKNWSPIVGLLLTAAIGLFIANKFFRWEKEEKISGTAKLWVLGVLAPFFLLGLYQGKTRQNIQQQKILTHEANRRQSILFTNVRVFVGNGMVIPNGAVLIRNGKIAQVFAAPPANATSLNAEIWDEAGRTLMPGLIDMHVHIGGPGGIYKDGKRYADTSLPAHRFAAYLYCGITAVRSTGDLLDSSLEWRSKTRSSEIFGAELFAYGPLFTAPGGHPTEMSDQMPASYRKEFEAQFVRLPKTPAEARAQVDDLKRVNVDGIKAVLDSGTDGWYTFNRLPADTYRSLITEAQAQHLPTATHTASAADVLEAANASTNTIEHGSRSDLIPPAVLAEMKAKSIAFDPTLSVFEAFSDLAQGKSDLLNRSLVQRVVPSDLVQDTRSSIAAHRPSSKDHVEERMFQVANQNVIAAYRAGVPLITGSDAGNMLVFHGPTVQHEMELWVKAGIPAGVALQAGTYTAARYLHADDRIGLIDKGHDATFLLVDGDPVQDITATERISEVFLRGEQVARYKLLQPDEQ